MRPHEPNKPYKEYARTQGFESSTYFEGETEAVFAERRNDALLYAAKRGDAESVWFWLNSGVDINHRDPLTGATALHFAAAYRARAVVRVLLATGHCDFLIRDKKGRLASEMAGVYGDDPVLARLLRLREKAQANEAGRPLRRR